MSLHTKRDKQRQKRRRLEKIQACLAFPLKQPFVFPPSSMASKLKVEELRSELAKRGLSTAGIKPTLVIPLTFSLYTQTSTYMAFVLNLACYCRLKDLNRPFAKRASNRRTVMAVRSERRGKETLMTKKKAWFGLMDRTEPSPSTSLGTSGQGLGPTRKSRSTIQGRSQMVKLLKVVLTFFFPLSMRKLLSGVWLVRKCRK